MTGSRVLVVDDEPQFLRALQTSLRGAGYDVETATTGEEALTKAALRPPEAIILDLVLPDLSGTNVCRELRGWSDVPVIVVSAVGEEEEKIAALMRRRRRLRDEAVRDRRAARSAARGSPTCCSLDGSRDRDRRSARRPGSLSESRGGERIHLTPIEFGLLRLFVQNEGKLLTHRTILREVWGYAYQEESSYLHVYISQLRRKIEPDPTRPRYLLNEPRAGYRLVDPSSRENS